MNRLEMQKQISSKIELLKYNNSEYGKEVERLRKRFVMDYPANKIMDLKLDDYVIGKGPENTSFCYRLERELIRLGTILGTPALKFGVYFQKKSGQYVSAKKWGENHKIAFNHIKKAICSLLDAAAKGDIEKVNSNNISAMFKGKLLAVYFPEIFAPIYSLTHLKYFVSHLNLKGNYLSGAEMQIAIMEYRNLWRELKEVFPCVFMFFLYQLFGSPASPLIRELDGEQGLPLLDEAIKGASFIDYMPPIIGNTGISDVASQRRQESNDGGQRFKVIGDRGEEIVLELEKQRLRNEKLYGLVNKVKHVAQFDDSAGFDILSYDNDGRERFIEVKSTVAQSIERGFYLTSNEYSKATTLDNYYIYFVFMACSKHPQVYPLCKPFSQRNKFNLRPVKYHVTGNPDNLLSGPRSGKRKKNQQRI